MKLRITHGAYGFFSATRERGYIVDSPEELVQVFSDTYRAFNHYNEPWGLQINQGDVLSYLWSTDLEEARDVWEELEHE